MYMQFLNYQILVFYLLGRHRSYRSYRPLFRQKNGIFLLEPFPNVSSSRARFKYKNISRIYLLLFLKKLFFIWDIFQTFSIIKGARAWDRLLCFCTEKLVKKWRHKFRCSSPRETYVTCSKYSKHALTRNSEHFRLLSKWSEQIYFFTSRKTPLKYYYFDFYFSSSEHFTRDSQNSKNSQNQIEITRLRVWATPLVSTLVARLKYDWR